MTNQRILDAAQILGEFGNGKMANELIALADRYRWRPISEIHEDLGQCVLINLRDCGYMKIGNNLDLDWDESEWTHFSQIVPMGQEEYERLKYQMEPVA
jgi:hypothetical protein